MNKPTKSIKLATENSFEKHDAHKKAKKTCTTRAKGHVATAIIQCNIGWGNTLFIRGDGAKLNWVKGKALTYDEGKDAWVFKATLTKPLEFKVLINDVQWSEGENFKLVPGQAQTFAPQFI